jgi:transposase, IS30 family
LLRRRRPKPVKLQADAALRTQVRARLAVKWSPQQIARYLRRHSHGDPAVEVCTETIYRAMYLGLLGNREGKLRTGRTRRIAQRRGVARRNEIPNLRPLSQRPVAVTDRLQPGHWEGDLIIGQGMRSAIATLVERTSRYVVLVPLPRGYKAPLVRDALIEALNRFPPGLRRTLTWDRGRELFWHEQITAATGTTVYFADAHSPWQRGSNENTNGLLRQYFPKHTDLSHDTRIITQVAHELNCRPRIVLDDRTPFDVMAHCLTTSFRR